ncbi:hypothetical protein [Neisseria meningitidis serogroup B]|uniref:Uncharacterized protein n=1 Tax=Neisseria meningitidis serogroup B TaxID=491 RepID=A0A0H5Q9Y6_NEIMI|nr:hypothetical protein [Neisseria meningitidis serogroup B]
MHILNKVIINMKKKIAWSLSIPDSNNCRFERMFSRLLWI